MPRPRPQKPPKTLQIVNKHPSTPLSHRFLKKNVERILAELKLTNARLEITLCADPFMRVMNRRHMKKSGTTDVLSFPTVSVRSSQIGSPKIFGNIFLGDVLVSLDQAARQARAQKITLAREVLFLILHSILHLIGHDHALPGETQNMQREESRIWRSIQS